MFATIKSLIPEPRQADQPRNYVGRHRQPETVSARATVPTPPPAPAVPQAVTTTVITTAPTSTVPQPGLATVSFLIPAAAPAPAAPPAPRRTPSPRPAPEAQTAAAPQEPGDSAGGPFPKAG